MSDWISIEERLPERSDTYLVYLGDEDHSVISIADFVSKNGGWDIFEKYYIGCTVTHWMPLPSPPKGKP